MKKISALIVATALMGFSTARAEEPAAESPAAKEWRSYIEPMLPMGERMTKLMAEPQDPLRRQELYRMLFMGFSTAYVGITQSNPEHPVFWPIWNPAFNWFAPNPDDAYSLAEVAADGVYKISGTRGTVRLVDFAIGTDQFIPRGDGSLAQFVGNYDIDTLHINQKTGAFEVILSAERPAGYKGDWWKLDAKAKYALVRQVSYDWLHEVDARLAIERLDRPAIPPRPTAAQIEADLKHISAFAESWTKFSIEWLDRIRARGLVNKVALGTLVNTRVGGKVPQQYIEGLFDFQPDEALIYETEVPKNCRYWNIELTDMLWQLIDVTNHQSNLNGYTARVDKDGKFRAVVAVSDPGVPNWLDTAGYTKGEFFGRWTDCSSTPTPTITKVKLADVRKYLPADTPVVTPEARDAAIRDRRKGVQLRKRW